MKTPSEAFLFMAKLIRLKNKFYQQNTFKMAKALLGKYLVRKIGEKTLVGKIVEVEAYYGFNDKASHASRGKTERTKIMFDKAGTAYIYMIYGMYYCLNIVTEKKDFPAAILIRALDPIKNIKIKTNGPGKLCHALRIDKKLNGENLIFSNKLYLVKNPKEKIRNTQIVLAKRIGIDYAGKFKHKLWRFYLKNNKFVSKK